VISGLTDDDSNGPHALGFSFPFYGNFYDEIYIGSNGIIGFGSSGMSSLSNVAIPSGDTPNDMLSWFWDDLNPVDPNNPGAHIYIDTTGGRCVIQFTDYPEYSGGAGDVITAQVILEPNGTITYNYLSVASGLDLTSSTIGIENAAGDDGLQVVFNNGSYLHDSLSIVFYAPYQWMEMDHSFGTLAGGGSDTIDVKFRTSGLEDGTYTGTIVITSNDPVNDVIFIDVQVNADDVPAERVMGLVSMGGVGQRAGVPRVSIMIQYVLFVKIIHNSYGLYPFI
jgi:hypothetical protein